MTDELLGKVIEYFGGEEGTTHLFKLRRDPSGMWGTNYSGAVFTDDEIERIAAVAPETGEWNRVYGPIDWLWADD